MDRPSESRWLPEAWRVCYNQAAILKAKYLCSNCSWSCLPWLPSQKCLPCVSNMSRSELVSVSSEMGYLDGSSSHWAHHQMDWDIPPCPIRTRSGVVVPKVKSRWYSNQNKEKFVPVVKQTNKSQKPKNQTCSLPHKTLFLLFPSHFLSYAGLNCLCDLYLYFPLVVWHFKSHFYESGI